ncbi:MAG: ABC transporter permease, partial [Candidatus Hodarchaeales archaeon]
ENFSLNNIINMSIREFRSILERNLDIHQDLYYFGWGNTLLVKSFPDFFQKDDYKCGFFHERVVEPSSDEEEPLFFSYYEFNSTNISPCEFSPSVESSIDVRFDLEKFDLFDVSNDLKNFEEHEHEFYLYTKLIEGDYLDDRYNYDIYIYNNFRWTLEGIQTLGTLLFTGIMLFTFPVIIIAIFIAYYSFGLIQRNALQSLSIYLTRGISRLQYFSFLIFEMFFSLFLAIIGAIILSIPITSLSLKTSDFFEFNRILEPVIPLFHLVSILLQIGILFALITNAIRIIRLSKLSISEVEEVIVEERKAPFWRRKYVDVILLSFGILFLALTLYSADFEIFLPPEFFLIFSLPSPLLIILGSVMLTSRLFSHVTGLIGTFLWEHQGSLVSFSLKNTAKHRHSATRALILVSLTLAFALAFLIFPFSFVSSIESFNHYQIGSDMTIELYSNELNETYIDYMLSNFSDQIDGYSTVLEGRLEEQRIMVINTSTFLDAAWIRNDFIVDAKKTVEELGENNTIMLYHENVELSGRKIGDSFLWTAPSYYGDYYQFERNVTEHSFKIIGEFYYWPRLVDHRPWEPQNDYFGVMSLETYYNLTERLGTEAELALQIHQLSVYIKPNEKMNQTYFKETIQEFDGVGNVNSFIESNNLFKEHPLYLLIIGQINSNIIYCVLIIFLVLVMFGFKQLIERSKEIATEIAVGMSLRQSFTVFLTETMWLVFFSIGIGFIFGIAFSSLFLIGLTQGPTFPPFEMNYPWDLISIVITILLVLGIVLSFIPAYLSSSLEVNKLLKVE